MTDSSPVRFINGDQLDHRKSNLTVGYQDVQIVKGNEYEVNGDKAYRKLKKRLAEEKIKKQRPYLIHIILYESHYNIFNINWRIEEIYFSDVPNQFNDSDHKKDPPLLLNYMN